jgi:TLC domain
MVVSDRILLDRSALFNYSAQVAHHSSLPDYPHWDMNPRLKRYYLMHSAYWCQQLIVLLLRLEKPRKDYTELVAHHFVTLWLIGYVIFPPVLWIAF